jgi:hypothetical protein
LRQKSRKIYNCLALILLVFDLCKKVFVNIYRESIDKMHKMQNKVVLILTVSDRKLQIKLT